MSHFPQDPQRPTMRRKSSAQNLLSAFKANPPSSSSPVPPPLNLPPGHLNATTLSFASAATPTTATPVARDWDAQSLHSDSVGSNLAGAQSPPLGQGTSVEYLRDLVQKRIITLTYIRNIHEGRSHWFHTILISRSELDKAFNNYDMKKQTYRFAILGLSLSSLLDINQPHDLLRGLINTITEFDQSKEEGENKSKMRIKFNKNKNPKKGASGIAEFTGSYVDTSADASYLVNPSIPFPLDYHQTLLSLLDVLSEVYNKIAKLLGPSPFPHSSQHMMGPLGLLSPHPGVSYLFSGDTPTQGGSSLNANPNHHSNPNLHQPTYPGSVSISGLPQDADMSGSLWSIAHAASGSSGNMAPGGTGPLAAIWTNSYGEMVLKIDGKLKKIISGLLKELDAFARNGIKDELGSLDPLLRNMDGLLPGGGSKPYDYDGMP
ncbi:hypothetical protein M413DRAFT_438680 [Hebeloma cylindrosporum]|uniref:Uncharacterized protein n=1 Tax=Hebeloma cylindrosporum TaxID=76867 RepID=A0A0C3CLB8_HEBCY|nr:hypothetical protein M413DRAFT_438680 [Hebeloma cylindrosporum h7]